MDAMPLSPFQETLGMIYFARMIDKIRKDARGELHPDYRGNLGNRMDARCVGYLRVTYDGLKARVLEGGTDEEVLRWCFATGRELNADDIMIWNHFLRKRGWRDDASASLAEFKRAKGAENRDDIQTILDFFEFDEGRKP